MNFLRVFVKNVQLQKNQLHQSAIDLKTTLQKFLEDTNISAEFSLQMLQTLFGPNTICHFSPKKNQELLRIITQRMKDEQV